MERGVGVSSALDGIGWLGLRSGVCCVRLNAERATRGGATGWLPSPMARRLSSWRVSLPAEAAAVVALGSTITNGGLEVSVCLTIPLLKRDHEQTVTVAPVGSANRNMERSSVRKKRRRRRIGSGHSCAACSTSEAADPASWEAFDPGTRMRSQ